MRPKLPRKISRPIQMLTPEWVNNLIECLKWAMDHPRGDGKSTYHSENAIHAIQRPGSAADGTGGDNYNGYFKVIKTADDKIKVVYGHDPDGAKCGYAVINNTVFNVDVSAELTISADAFIYIESVYDTGTDTTGTPTFKQSSSHPAYEENKYKKVLANVYFADEKITGDPIQQHYGEIIGQTFGECE